MVYLDLEEWATSAVLRKMISRNRFAPMSFLRRDHLHTGSGPLVEDVRAYIKHETGITTRGPIRLLTQLRYFGYYFSPLNLYYCFDETGSQVELVVAEVSNTPWREQHGYVLWDGNRSGGKSTLSFKHPKRFHVSPFLGMDVHYNWKLSEPTDKLQVEITNTRGDQRLFDATLKMQRRPMTQSQLSRTLVRYPLMTATIMVAIYFQALKLWWKKCPFYSHPKKQSPSVPA